MSREVAFKTLAGAAVIQKCDWDLGICFQNCSLMASKSVLAFGGRFQSLALYGSLHWAACASSWSGVCLL